jgi:hypothetical protein
METIESGQDGVGWQGIETVLETAQFRYIRFGPKGSWAAQAIEDGLLLLGHKEVPHELALSGDKPLIAGHLEAMGKVRSKASDFAREISDFYHLGGDTIWITFHNGRLYWTIAEGKVTWLGADNPIGARRRRVRFPWRNTDLKGAPLIEDHLISLLTKVTAYQQTLCRVDAHYLRRILTGHKDPDVLSAQQALSTLTTSAATLIGKLHQDDFETLVGILLERQGYHRASRIGGTQKDVDMVVEAQLQW